MKTTKLLAGCCVVLGMSGIGMAQSAGEKPAATGLQERTVLAQPEVFSYEKLPANKMPNGGESRDILLGSLPTGEAVSVHESVLPKGVAPNAPHRIDHSEIITVIDGEVAFEHDGKAERVGKGGVIFVALGTLHTLRNVGDGPARYCVVAIGGDIKP